MDDFLDLFEKYLKCEELIISDDILLMMVDITTTQNFENHLKILKKHNKTTELTIILFLEEILENKNELKALALEKIKLLKNEFKEQRSQENFNRLLQEYS